MTRRGPAAPAHLSRESAKWWREVTSTYELESHHLRLLTLACESWDRAQEARRRIADEGSYILDRYGVPRAHPAIAVERDSTVRFARILRELALDVSEPGEVRPPAISGHAGLRRPGGGNG
jgi:P27 family predicted phage terminase small subunit